MLEDVAKMEFVYTAPRTGAVMYVVAIQRHNGDEFDETYVSSEHSSKRKAIRAAHALRAKTRRVWGPGLFTVSVIKYIQTPEGEWRWLCR